MIAESGGGAPHRTRPPATAQAVTDHRAVLSSSGHHAMEKQPSMESKTMGKKRRVGPSACSSASPASVTAPVRTALGRPPRSGELAIVPTPSAAAASPPEKEQMLKSLKQNLQQAQNRMKKYADMKRTERHFEVGDMVYLKMQPYRQSALGLRNALKLSSKYYGPFRALQKVGHVS